jgi:hypothetical protein
MYAKLIDGQLVSPPQVSKQPDGSTVIGYDQRSDLLEADGYKPVVLSPRPGEYYAASWQDDGAQITQVWTAYEPPAPPPPPPDPLEPFAATIQAFSELWASLQIGPVPTDWTEAMTLLAGQPAETQIKLLAYRVALTPVWDALLERMAGNA